MSLRAYKHNHVINTYKNLEFFLYIQDLMSSTIS